MLEEKHQCQGRRQHHFLLSFPHKKERPNEGVLLQVGCKTKWDKWSDPNTSPCASARQFRLRSCIDIYFDCSAGNMNQSSPNWRSLSQSWRKCFRWPAAGNKPCKYKKYSFLGEPYPSAFKSEHYIFSLWAVPYKTKVETEELIYPSSSLVAEFGGILSLFLGFSFISLWDNFSSLKRFLRTQN